MRKPLLLLGLLLFGQYAVAQQAPNIITAAITDELIPKGYRPFEKTVTPDHIPFHLNGGLIFFEAKLNGVPDTFVLDTGSPGLLLNENSDPKDENSFAAVGVNGGLIFQKKVGHSFQIGNLSNNSVTSLSANLSHLEKVKRQSFRGMVGHKLFQGHELFLDYQNLLMRLLNGGAKEEIKGYHRKRTIPLDTQQHFAVLKVKIGRRTYHFGIDTGAEVNVIDENVAKWLPARLFQIKEKIKIRGVSKKGVGADVGRISTCIIGEEELNNMSFVIMNMDTLNEGKNVQLDGLLGYPFLSSGLFSIDYVSKLLYIWERE